MGKKVPILWEKYEYRFPSSPDTTGFVGYFRKPVSQLSPFNGFGCLFPDYGKLMGKHMYFPRDEVYHKMGI